MNLTPYGQPHRWIALDDAEIPYWRIGNGPDLFFVHGWPLDGRTWRHAVAALSDRYTCHVIDLPGTGSSRWDEHTSVTVDSNTAAIITCIETVGIERFALVGHDSGGQFARAVAAQMPGRCWGMVLGNTEVSGYVPWMLKAMVQANKMPGSRASMRAMLRSKVLRKAPMALGGCFADLSYADGEFHDIFLAPLLTSDEAYAGQMLLAQGLDLSAVEHLPEIHADISAPVQMIWGTDDPWFPLERAEAMRDEFGGPTEMVRIDGGKLFAHEEFGASWTAAAAAFLGRVAPSAARASAASE